MGARAEPCPGLKPNVARAPFFPPLIPKPDPDLSSRLDDVVIDRYGLHPADGFADRNGLDIRRNERNHPAECALADQPCGCGTESRSENTVERCGLAAALKMPE